MLDNCEQLLAAAGHVAALLQAAPALTVLATSRAPLQLSGEQQFAVPPLALPDPQHENAVAQVAQSEAGALFIARAQAVRRDFALSPATAPAVAAICRRLDGLPLAIELAAARTTVLSPPELLQRLEQRLPLLTGGSRDLPARQQTIRATLDWSYQLLAAREQTLFRRLGVFAGGFTLAAAEAVCRAGAPEAGEPPLAHAPAGSQSVVDGLQALVDQSLLQHGEQPTPRGDAEPRFRMLEVVREYANEHLVLAGEVGAFQRRHAEHYLALAEATDREQHGRGALQPTEFEQLEAEHDNLRAALHWALDEREAALALRLGTALGPFWLQRGDLTEGRRWLDAAVAAGVGDPTVPPAVLAKALLPTAALAESQDDVARADALFADSLLRFQDLGDRPGIAAALEGGARTAWKLGEYRRGVALREEQLVLARALGNQHGIAWALLGLGWVAHDQGDFGRAFALLEESLSLQRALGDQDAVAFGHFALGVAAYQLGDFVQAAAWMETSLALFEEGGNHAETAEVLAHLGSIAGYQGNGERAVRLLDEAQALFQAQPDMGTGGIALTLRFRGKLAQQQGAWARAQAAYEESLRLQRGMGGKWEMVACLEGLAGVADGQDQAGRAARVWGAAEAQRERMGAPVPPAERARYAAAVAHTRAALGEAGYAAAWAEGRALTLEQAIAYALDERSDATAQPEAARGQATGSPPRNTLPGT